MIHPTYRRLDEPPKLGGFSFLQWLALIALAGAVYGLEKLLVLATQPAISLFTFTVGGPAALMYFSEATRPSLLRLIRDGTRWLARPRRYEPGVREPRTLTVLEPAAQSGRRARGRGRR